MATSIAFIPLLAKKTTGSTILKPIAAPAILSLATKDCTAIDSHDYAYRSHFFQIDFKNRSSYYKAGDPPASVVEEFRSQVKEIALWDGICSRDHPILQKAKAECEVLGLNKSIATRIWNKNTLETFSLAWEARKQK